MQSRVSRFLLLFLCLALCGGCAGGKRPELLTQLAVPFVPFSLPVPNIFFFLASEYDYSGRTWPGAFDATVERLAVEYPFTDWKQVDWQALHEEFAPRIADAETAEDPDIYYLALREFLYRIPDPNLGISDNEPLRMRHMGGGFGFAAVPLSDGRILAHHIHQDRSVYEAGMQPGAEIVSWNDQPVLDAIAATPITWASSPAGTARSRFLSQVELTFRAPPGASATVSWKNPGDATLYTAACAAIPDDYETLRQMRPYEADLEEVDSPLEFRMLDSGHAYIRVLAISHTLSTPFLDRAFQERIWHLTQQQVSGLVLDLRGNKGGVDHLVPALAGHFYEVEGFYEDVATYQPRRQQFETMPNLRLTVPPLTPHFGSPVVVLVDHTTDGPAGALAMLLQRLPHVRVLGFEPTRGGTGISAGNLTLPEGIGIFYPTGRSLDADGNIQLEADAAGVGGVVPDILLEMTEERAMQIYGVGEDVLLLEAQKLLSQWHTL